MKTYTVVPYKEDATENYWFMLADIYAPAGGTKDVFYSVSNPLKVLPTDRVEVAYTISGIDFTKDYSKQEIQDTTLERPERGYIVKAKWKKRA